MFLKRQSTRLISRHSLLWKAVKHCIWTWTLHLRTPLGQLQKAHLHIFQYFWKIERSGHFGCLRYPFFPLSCCHRTFVPLGFWQTYDKKQSRFVQHGEESQGKQYQLQVFPDISDMNSRGMIEGRKSAMETTTFLTLFLDNYMRKHDLLCLLYSLKDYIPVPLQVPEYPHFFSSLSHLLTLPSGLTPIQTYPYTECFVPYFLGKHQNQVSILSDS